MPGQDGAAAEVEDVVEDAATIVDDEVLEEVVVRIVDEVDDATEIDEKVVATGIISL